MKVLVADDSIAFRRQIKKALNHISGIDVIGTAPNGRVALHMIEQNSIDLILLGLNMPEMDGFELLTRIGEKGLSHPKVIVFARQADGSAQNALKALSLGATDFLLRPEEGSAGYEEAIEKIGKDLASKMKQFVDSSQTDPAFEIPPQPIASQVKTPPAKISVADFVPAAIAIASSTGGPGALESLFKHIRPPVNVPILIAQHMPQKFTKYLAQRISDISGIECREGEDGESIQAGIVYVAPGDFHMRVVKVQGQPCIALDQGEKINSVRPAADALFESMAKFYGKTCMAFVLTGMGQDGCIGAQKIKDAGGCVMIQDKATSVVWGMPGAVFAANAYDHIGSLDACAGVLARMSRRKDT